MDVTDFWEIIYGRRSIRKFDKSRPVPRELLEKILDAAIWAPSSCNYQMWDFVIVNDPMINEQLGALSTQMANAPVNIVVSYGRDYSEEAWANIQSASAAIENMSLAAHAVGLGTFWITQTGDPERVRSLVGLPHERLVVAVLAVGYPAVMPKRAPKRRPASEVVHWNHYAGRPVPSSRDPEDWDLDLLRLFQRARVRNGNRHNKPREWERLAVLDAVARLRPPARPEGRAQWIDLLPTHGLYSELVSVAHRDVRWSIADLSSEVLEFSTPRTLEPAEGFLYPPRVAAVGESNCLFHTEAPAQRLDVAMALFRLENIPPSERAPLLKYAFEALKPGGFLILGFVNRRSYHGAMESMRMHGAGPKGVEYVLAPEPSIGPFEPLTWTYVSRLTSEAGFRAVRRLGYHVLPTSTELRWRLRNKPTLMRLLVAPLAVLARTLDTFEAWRLRWGRLQFVLFEKP